MATVLVVDDEPSVAEIVVLALEDAGFRVVSASDGAEALDRLAEIKPDLIITDYMMPRLDGPGFIKQVHKIPDYRQVPIIVMSAVAVPSLNDLDSGSVRYLRKPFRLATVLAVVKDILGDKH